MYIELEHETCSNTLKVLVNIHLHGSMNRITSKCTDMSIQDSFEPMKSHAWVLRIFFGAIFHFQLSKANLMKGLTA